jgi:DNA polymerase I
MDDDKRLFLLDAYALIFRSYYAFIKNPRVTSKGLNTSAIFGFLLTLEDVLTKQNPTHIAVAFDPPGGNFRSEIYPDYKAHRDATPEDIIKAVPYIKRLLDAFDIPVIEVAGFEADDVIGTLAVKAAKEGYTTYMMTPDKDYAQLVTDKILMYKPARSGGDAETLGPDEIVREYGVRPSSIVDLLGLMGDSSDNIPGAPGIGPKTARKLIEEFGDIENLLLNTEKLQGKQKEAIEQNREQVMLSKKLATIETNVPVEFHEESFHRTKPDIEKLRSLYEELEFRNMAARLEAPASSFSKSTAKIREESGGLFASAREGSAQGTLFETPVITPAANTRSIDQVEHKYIMIIEMHDISNLVAEMSRLSEFCFDTETTSLDPLTAELVAISFCWKKGEGKMIYFPADRREATAILDLLKPLFSNHQIKKVGQNLKFDIQVLAGYGVSVEGDLFDTMIAHYLLEPDQRHNMDTLAINYLGYRPVPIEDLIGERGPRQKNMRDVPADKITEYAVEDADITWQLREVFESMLEKTNLSDLARNIEMPLIPVLARMERWGISINEPVLNNYAQELRIKIIELEKAIYTLAGSEFNISSPKQLGDILFIRLKLDDNARLTKTKQFRTDEEVLQRLTGKHEIVGKVLEYRGLKKLLSTYVESLPLLVSPVTKRIHTTYNQAVAATGRLSSTNPNLQNIPVRDEEGKEIRRAFVPADGKLFLSADYSQIELRLMACLSKDESMLSDFRSGQDIHTATAAKIFKVPISEVTREMRSRAKTANFGIIYGISAFGLSERLTIGRKEAKELIDGYFATYPGVKNYMDESIAKARESGFVTTMYGRRRYLPDIHSRNQVVRGNAERNSINAPLQGSAADIIKIAMIRIDNRLRKEMPDAEMILQVHDELIFEVNPDAVEKLKSIVVNEMKNAASLVISLEVDTGTGSNWLEAH